MTESSIDILRQSGFDLWLLVCAFASLVLLVYAATGRLWRRSAGFVLLPLILASVLGTLVIGVTPRLHNPFVGLVWTFIQLAILSTTFYLNLLPQLGAARMGILLSLRIIALAALVPMLFEPVLRFVSKPKPERLIQFLIDTSGSMSFPDLQNGPTRLQSVWQTLRPQLARINDNLVPQFFTFSTDIEALKKPDDLAKRTADGKATDIAGAISRLLSKAASSDAVVVLVSDGIDNASPNVADLVRASKRPIHTVRVGSEQAEPASVANVAIDNVENTDDFIVDHESRVRVTVKSTALANRVVDVRMSELDEAGRPVGKLFSQTLVLQPLPEGQVIEMPFKPRVVGVQRLAVWIDPIAGERSTVDNRQEFQGLALDPRIKVLYVEGRVRPEYRDLSRALARDPNIEVATLLRVTADQFKAGGTVNGETFEAMPASHEDWKKFDVIILGDLDASFLTKPQQAAIEQRTSNGGGLLMIGGQNSFGPGGYKDTPVEKALPVFVGDTSAAQEKTQFVPSLTADGVTHPAMEGLEEWFGGGDSAKAKKQLPPLRGNVVVPRPKAGAQVLLTHAGRPGPDGQPQIVLAVERYGEGRSAALTIDTTYLWYTPLRGLGQDSPYNRFWGQLVRWLAGEDTRNRSRGAGVDGLLNKSMYQLGENVRVRAMVRDQRGDATRFAQVSLKLRRAGAREEQQIPLSPVETRVGLYDCTIPNPDKGDWIAVLTAGKDGNTLGTQELKFTVIPPAEEMLKLAANPALLKRIAQDTQGFHYDLAQLPTLIDQIIRQRPPLEARAESVSLANSFRTLLFLSGARPDWPTKYDLPMQALLVLLLLTTEWILRRRWQLP